MTKEPLPSARGKITRATRIVGLIAANLGKHPESFRLVEKFSRVVIYTTDESRDQGRILGKKGMNINALREVCLDLGLEELRLVDPVKPSQLVGDSFPALDALYVIRETAELRSSMTGVQWDVSSNIETDGIIVEIRCENPLAPAVQNAYGLLFHALLRKEWGPINPDFDIQIEWLNK